MFSVGGGLKNGGLFSRHAVVPVGGGWGGGGLTHFKSNFDFSQTSKGERETYFPPSFNFQRGPLLQHTVQEAKDEGREEERTHS